MSNTRKCRQIISAIEEFRIAYWSHKDIKFVKTKNYKPLVGHVYRISSNEGAYHIVNLYDTWIEVDRPGHFFLGRDPVEKSSFYDKELEHALERLLEFTKHQFIDDNSFNNITY